MCTCVAVPLFKWQKYVCRDMPETRRMMGNAMHAKMLHPRQHAGNYEKKTKFFVTVFVCVYVCVRACVCMCVCV